jgi:hypothetical protein
MQADATVAPAAPLAPETPAQLAAAPSRVAAGRARWMRSCLAVDAATLTATVIASTVDIRGGSLHWWFSPWTCVFALLTVSLFQIRGLYQRRLRPSVLDDLRRLAGAISVAAMTVLTARLLVEPLAASELVRPWAFALVYVVGGRAALYWSHGKARAAGEALSRRSSWAAGVSAASSRAASSRSPPSVCGRSGSSTTTRSRARRSTFRCSAVSTRSRAPSPCTESSA